MWDPYDHAAREGIRVVYRAQPDRGRWYPRPRIITLDFGLTTITERCVLAHELGHAHYGHDCTTDIGETQANRWAAQRLITVDQIVECALAYPDHPGKWCVDLQTTPTMLAAWLSDQTNLDRAEQLWRAVA